MELYLLAGLVFIYIITATTASRAFMWRVWTSAFILAFALMALSMIMLRINSQDVMMNTGELNWYYFLYIFGALSVALGIINLWMYRRSMWNLIFPMRHELEEDKKHQASTNN